MELSTDRDTLFEYIRRPMIPHNHCYSGAAERCIELYLETMEERKHDFIGWFLLKNIYTTTAQYGVAPTAQYRSEGHNKLLTDMFEAYREVFTRVKQITMNPEWDKEYEQK